MSVINSHQNARLKQVRVLLNRKRERARTGLFVAEGEDLVGAAAAAGWDAEDLLVHAGSGLEGTEVDPALLDGASSLGSGTRAIGIYRQRWLGTAVGPRCLHLHGLKDPGNVGTAIRAAHALGASCVSIGPDTADPYAPKAVRASMGSVFAVPLARADGPAELPGTTVALVLRAGEVLRPDLVDGADADGLSLLVGAEREGLPDDVVAACDRTAHVPIAGAESLNAAMAATVALYELARTARG
ncbi:TrmH family RNA methyltransferase [Patulibacter minatonensis]|uniref:TrmH family RNA methyltransferase n=1 Tax=Patulibacter minatonensis TaxID=298163 RepID=UPI00047A4907|nr:RNA methyltransferase [Patulibacter minatonensis]